MSPLPPCYSSSLLRGSKGAGAGASAKPLAARLRARSATLPALSTGATIFGGASPCPLVSFPSLFFGTFSFSQFCGGAESLCPLFLARGSVSARR